MQIDSVRITLQNTGLDTLITDVTNLVKREDIIKVKPGDHANITIYTNESDAFAFCILTCGDGDSRKIAQ